jgi:uncharacterized membrane protein
MTYQPEPLDVDNLELERQKKSQRRINILLIIVDLALLGFVIYEIIEKFANI